MKYLFVIIMSFIMTFSMSAQEETERGKHSQEKMLSHLKSKLDLSETQLSEITNIMEAHKSQEGKEAKKELMESINSVLDEDQKALMEDMKLDRMRGHSRKGKGDYYGKGKHFHQGEKKDMDDESMEKLKEMRAILEKDISSEDKETISRLRAQKNELFSSRQDHRESFKKMSDEEKMAFKKSKKAEKKSHKEDFKELNPLLDKYKDQIKDLFEENKEFFKAKKLERKEEFKKSGHVKRMHKESGGHESHFDKRKATYFLLLDPSIEPIEKFGSIQTISAFPNPSKGQTTISYSVQNDGKILIELRNESGQIVKVISNEFHKRGSYTKEVNFSDLQNQSYFISISDGKSIQTEKMIIQK